MVTCKDCLHYERCKSINNDIEKLFEDATMCVHFKDKNNYAEVKHGKWKMGVDEADYEYGTCSICGYVESDSFSRCNHPFYCSNCGAKMDGDVENENTSAENSFLYNRFMKAE